MRLLRTQLALSFFVAICAVRVSAQVPNVIQIFMPGGGMPPHEMRFELARDDGRIETLFTDSKGKYSMERNLVRAGGYTVTVTGDRATFETTVVTFRLVRASDIAYVPVFLRPLKSPPVVRAKVLDVSALDENVPEEARAAYRDGMDLIVKGQAEPGIASLKRAETIYPQYLRAINDLGVVYMKLNRLEEAADAFGRALKTNARFAFARLNLGITLNRMGKHAEAAALLETLFKENPELPAVRENFADALYDAGRLPECDKLLRSALGDVTLEQKQKAEMHYKLGRVLSREEKTTEAVKELQRATELEPTGFNAYLLLGGNLLRLKRAAEAERALLRAYELGGSDAAPAQLMLGQLYFDQKRFDLAAHAFEQYVQDKPDAKDIGQIKDVVARLKSPAEKK
ncbi:MAG: tetratricopeptide repeat protein [Pyrinomonadaceae bacterium]